jgi:8-oxo-dGTP pyrophosphatase MutT (NUDIX family)
MKQVLTAGGILINGDEVLLVKKGGKYLIPKGHLEGSETVEQAAVREVREETGYQAKVVGHYGSLVRQSTEDSGELVQKRIEVFKMESLGAANTPVEEDSEWVHVSDALDNMLYEEERVFMAKHLA